MNRSILDKKNILNHSTSDILFLCKSAENSKKLFFVKGPVEEPYTGVQKWCFVQNLRFIGIKNTEFNVDFKIINLPQ